MIILLAANITENNAKPVVENPMKLDEAIKTESAETNEEPIIKKSNGPAEIPPRLKIKIKGIDAFEAILSECGDMQSKTFNGSDTVQFDTVPDQLCTLQLLPIGAMIRIKGGDRRYECTQGNDGGLSCQQLRTP